MTGMAKRGSEGLAQRLQPAPETEFSCRLKTMLETGRRRIQEARVQSVPGKVPSGETNGPTQNRVVVQFGLCLVALAVLLLGCAWDGPLQATRSEIGISFGGFANFLEGVCSHPAKVGHIVCGFCRSVGTIPSSLGAQSGLPVGFSGQDQRTHHVLAVLFHSSLLEKHQDGQRCRSCEIQNSYPNQPPIVRRFTFVVLSGGLLIVCCYCRDSCIRRRRKWLGRLLIGSGFLLYWASLALIVLSGFRWSWGWWL